MCFEDSRAKIALLNDLQVLASGYTILHGSSDQSFMVDPLSYFSFQPVLHNWCNKRLCCYPVCGNDAYKRTLAANWKGWPMFPLSLSEWSFTICLAPGSERGNLLQPQVTESGFLTLSAIVVPQAGL